MRAGQHLPGGQSQDCKLQLKETWGGINEWSNLLCRLHAFLGTFQIILHDDQNTIRSE